MPRKPFLRFAVLTFAGAVLAGCASLSEDQCRAGDWRGIGFVDGTAGRTTDHIAQHQKACAKLGITPDLSAWLAGREQGLQSYCTPERAYGEGRAGRSMSPVCPAASQSTLREAHYAGRQYYDLGQEIGRLQVDLQSVDSAMDDLPNDAASERRRLRDEGRRLDRRIADLERDRSRYDSWPG